MEQAKTNKMGIVPVKKLLIYMGIPIIISMMLQALYNIVDSAFVGNMAVNGDEAVNALTLAFPVQMLIVAIAIGTGVGANALLSKSLGQGDKEKVNRVAGNALFLGACIYVVFLLFGIFGVEIYVNSQTSNELIRGYATEYLRICCTLSFGIIFFSIYEKLLQSTGKTLFSTIGQIAGAVTNIILDPIMIYGLGVCPEMGIKGAAFATVIGQIVSVLADMAFHFIFNKEISNHIKYWRPRGKLILEIYSIGLPAIIAQALMSFMTYGMNLILNILDPVNGTYVTAYGVYYKIQQFVLFAAFGLRDTITPVISFNYGVKDKKRVQDGMKYGLIYTLAVMVIGLVLLESIASPLARVFHLSGTTQALCVDAMHIVSVSLLFAGVCVALQGVFQALGSGLASLIISVCRQFIFVIPVALGFAFLAKAHPSLDWLVWVTFIIAELISAAIAVIMLRSIHKKKVSALGAGISEETEVSGGEAAEEQGDEAQDQVATDGSEVPSEQEPTEEL